MLLKSSQIKTMWQDLHKIENIVSGIIKALQMKKKKKKKKKMIFCLMLFLPFLIFYIIFRQSLLIFVVHFHATLSNTKTNAWAFVTNNFLSFQFLVWICCASNVIFLMHSLFPKRIVKRFISSKMLNKKFEKVQSVFFSFWRS